MFKSDKQRRFIMNMFSNSNRFSDVIPVSRKYEKQIDKIYNSPWIQEDEHIVIHEPLHDIERAFHDDNLESLKDINLIVDNNKLQGIIQYRKPKEDSIYIDKLYILPSERGKKISTEVLNKLADKENVNVISGISSDEISNKYWEHMGAQLFYPFKNHDNAVFLLERKNLKRKNV